MNNNFSFKPWIHFVSKRFSIVDNKGKSAVTTRLSSLGICFGVMTLIVVLSVMNGFQAQFIDSIIELSSYHVQVTDVEDENIRNDISSYLTNSVMEKNVVSFIEFKEAQSLMTDKYGKESAAIIRAVPKDVLIRDAGFKKEMEMVSGSFDIEDDNSIILGVRLAKALGVRVGNTVNLFALSGSGDTELISNNRTFTVKGIFSCGYADINASFAFINLSSAEKYFGSEKLVYGIKLKNQNSDRTFQKEFEKSFPNAKTSVWRDYNRSFFGALRVEKNMLFLLVVMIFIVVAINIYNSMRKLVFERRIEISTLASLGADNNSIQNIFVYRSLVIALKGALPGLLLGLLLSHNIRTVFVVLAKIEYWFTYLYILITNSSAREFIHENTMWYVYANIPARIIPGEVIFITAFGILSCVIASYMATKSVLKMKISEVFHEE